MKRYRLSQTEMQRMQRDQGALAENIAAGEYDFKTTASSDFDGARDTGTVFEVKSTVTRLNNGNPGRFRLWKKQHERLTRKDRNGSAWYIFVLLDVESRPVEAQMVRKKPAEVGRIVGARGGWNRSGHHKGAQRKLPFSQFFAAQ